MRKRILLLLKAGLKFENRIKEYLTHDGFEVDTARNVAEALNKLKRAPHFILLVEQESYESNEMDCLELCLNVLDIQANVHVLVLGSKDSRNKAEIVRLGGIYLDRPIEVEALKKIMNELPMLDGTEAKKGGSDVREQRLTR
jgi:DNA-binding response OmpR family regulator